MNLSLGPYTVLQGEREGTTPSLFLLAPEAAHDADAGAPVFVDVEAIDLDVGGDAVGECLERRVNAQSWSDEIDEWWLVTDHSRAEEFRFCDVAAAPMGFNASPVIRALQHVLAIF